MDELCAIALAAADATGAEVAAAVPANGSSRRSKPTGLSGSEWQLAKNRERNRLHARKSRARKKVFVESLRADAEAFTTEWNTLRRLCLSVTGIPFRVRPPVSTDAAAASSAAQLPPDADADGDAEGEADAAAAAAGGLRPGSKLRMDRVERSRERNKIHARRSRQRKKVLVEALEQSLASCRADIADMRAMLEAREGPHLSVLAAIPRAQNSHPMDGAAGAADGDEDEDDEDELGDDDEGPTDGIVGDSAAAEAGAAAVSSASTGALASVAPPSHSNGALGCSDVPPTGAAFVALGVPPESSSVAASAAIGLLPPPVGAALSAGQRQRSNASVRSARSKGPSATTPSAAASTSWAGGNAATVDSAAFGAAEPAGAGGVQGPALLSAATSSRVSGRQRKPSTIVAEAIAEELSSRGKRSGGPASSGPGAGTAAGARQVQGLAATLAAVTAAGRQRSREASPAPPSRALHGISAAVVDDDFAANAGMSHPPPSMHDEGGTTVGSASPPGVDAMMLLSGAAASVRSPLAAQTANSDSSRSSSHCGGATSDAAGNVDGADVIGRFSDDNSDDSGHRSGSNRVESRSPERRIAECTSGGNSSNSSHYGGSASSETGSDTAPPGATSGRPAAAVEQSNADRWGQYHRAQAAQLHLLEGDGAVGAAFGASSEEGDEDGEVPSQSGSAASTVTGTAVCRFPSAASSASSASSEGSTATAHTATAFSVASRSTEAGSGAARASEARASDASLSASSPESAECAAAVPRKPLSSGAGAGSALETAAALAPPCPGHISAIIGCKRGRSAWDAKSSEAAEHAETVGECGHGDSADLANAPTPAADSGVNPDHSLQAKRARGNEQQSAAALAADKHTAHHQPDGGTTAC